MFISLQFQVLNNQALSVPMTASCLWMSSLHFTRQMDTQQF